MGYLDYVLGLSAEAPSLFPPDPNERAWRTHGHRDAWGGFSGSASTGSYIQADDAIGVSCVFLAVRVYANLLGTSQVRFYRNRPRDEGEDQIYNHSLLSVLSPDGRANPWQSGALWRMWSEAQAFLWGLGLSEIKFGGGGRLELWPIEAEHVPQIDQLDSGMKRFTIAEPGKPVRTLMQDQVYQLEGFGTHKLIPESLLRRSREAVAVWLAQQQFRGTYYERGAAPSLIFKHPGKMSDPAIERFKKQVQGRIGGNRNAHKTVIVEEGMEITEFGHTARNALLVEAWDAQAVEISRWSGIPAYMFGVSKQPPYNSREQATREFLDLFLKPKAILTEGAIKHSLIVEPDVVCEIDLDYLKRGDALTQAQTDAIYMMHGADTVNENRRSRGKNPLPGGDVASRAANLDRGGDPRQPRPENPGDREASAHRDPTDIAGMLADLVPGVALSAAESVGFERSDERAGKVLQAAAQQLLRREVEQIRRRAVQLASDPPAWSVWLEQFYGGHLEIMAERLAIAPARARVYAEGHMREVASKGISVCDEWEADSQAIKEMVAL